MEKRISDLKEFLKKVKELRGYGDMNSFKVVKDYDEIAEEAARDGIDNIIEALSSPVTYDKLRKKMIANVGDELNQIEKKAK